MSLVKLKTRKEWIEVSQERAKTLQNRRLGLNGERRRAPTDTFDAGGECKGTYGNIEDIKITPDPVAPDKSVERIAAADKTMREIWVKKSPEEKAEAAMPKFEIYWGIKRGFKTPIPAELRNRVMVLHITFFRENPKEMSVPKKTYDQLLKIKS